MDSGRLTLRYQGELVADLSMDFCTRVGRRLSARRPGRRPDQPLVTPATRDFTADLVALLGHWDMCSKEWIVRQYDHEVQGRTVIKPMVGDRDDGPGDAAVVLPVRGSNRGLAVGCGLNPRLWPP